MQAATFAPARAPAGPGLRWHWSHYAIEAGALGAFMISATLVTALVEHPASALRQALPDAFARRAITGVAMGLTAAAIIYSRWGQRSGAHMNPSVTLAFLRLGKISRRDAAAYVVAQFVGGLTGVLAASSLIGAAAAHPAVNYVATVPGQAGIAAAFASELAISFGLMTMVLAASNSPRFARWTGAFAACLVAGYITFEAPLSGMSMNPARSFGPAVAAGTLESLWIYLIAPPAGMMAAADVYRRQRGHGSVRCAKLHHPAGGPCHFNCAHGAIAAAGYSRPGTQVLTRAS